MTILALGPVGIRGNLDQCSNQSQEGFVFRPLRLSVEKCSKLNVREAAARWCVRLMDNERAAVLWLSP